MSTPLPRKRLDFKPGCMRGKSVRKVPGVGETSAQNLERAGFRQAADLKRKAQSLNFNKEKFQEWMKDKCGANLKHSSECFDFLLDWHLNDKKLVPNKQSLKVCKRINIQTKNQTYSVASSSAVCINSPKRSHNYSRTSLNYDNRCFGAGGSSGTSSHSISSCDSLERYNSGPSKRVYKRMKVEYEYSEHN